MLNVSDTAHPPQARCLRCVHCGRYCHPDDTYCPQCNQLLEATAPVVTMPLSRAPLTLAVQNQGDQRFETAASALLQFLPSGACFWLALDTPATLGRTNVLNNQNVLDLTDLNAYWHGVSREHCLLRRVDRHLIITDLASRNGTYLNGELLLPHQDYGVADGSQVILGTLHLTVFFSV